MAGDPVGPSPKTYALALGAAYVVLAGTYIVVSGELAARFAADLADLQHVEQIKGLVFVAVTGGLLSLLSWWMFERLARSGESLARSREALLRADRHATPGLLAASIAHDFNNLLTVMLANADLLDADVHTARGRELLDDLRAAVDRGSQLARTLSRTGKTSASGQPSTVDVVGIVREAVDLVRHHPKARARTVTLEADGPLIALVYPLLVHQVVTNLVINALDAVGEGGQVRVVVTRETQGWTVEVQDDGPGVPEALRARLFDPFYTTKADGTGLGLVSVQTCTALHRGSVEVGTSALGGAAFRVSLHEPLPTG